MGSTRPNPTHVGWVGLGWTYVIGWIGLNFFFLTHHDGLGPKISSTRPMHTPNFEFSHIFSFFSLFPIYLLFFLEKNTHTKERVKWVKGIVNPSGNILTIK